MLGAESRGFILGGGIARALGAGFVAARKPGKLPGETIGHDYALEYGTDRLEIQRGAIRPGQRVLVHDDLLATGGTGAAKIALVEAQGGIVVGTAFVIELDFLGGRQRLAPTRGVVAGPLRHRSGTWVNVVGLDIGGTAVKAGLRRHRDAASSSVSGCRVPTPDDGGPDDDGGGAGPAGAPSSRPTHRRGSAFRVPVVHGRIMTATHLAKSWIGCDAPEFFG